MNDDLQKYLMFKAVLEQGEFEIKGKAITQVALLFNWFGNLEKKFRDEPPKEPKPTGFKPVGPPVKLKDVK